MQKRNIIHKICDLNCETLWNEDSAIEDYILSLIKTHRKKGPPSRITCPGSLAPRERFGFARFSLSLKQSESNFCPRLGLTKRNEDRFVSHELDGDAVARSSTGRFSRFATRSLSLPFPVLSPSSTIEFLSKLAASFPLFDSTRW